MKHAWILSALCVVACGNGSSQPGSATDMSSDATVPDATGFSASSSSSGANSSGSSSSGSTSGSSSGSTSGSSSGSTSSSSSGSTGSSSGGFDGGSSSSGGGLRDASAADQTISGGSSSGGSGSSSSGSEAGSTHEAGSGGGEGGAPPGGPVNVLTNRYDNGRSGANTNETILTTSNVNTATFGFKFSAPVTGRVYGQPLYVSNLMLGGAQHNVVYVATEHNMVYAFDADDGTQLWATTLEPPATLGSGAGATYNPGCADMGSGATMYEVGITSTPVIDPVAGLIYVVDKTIGKQMIHALSLTTGKDGLTPAQIGPAGFSSDIHLNRPGLLLLNGVVYLAFGSHCDSGAYHGWIFGYDAKTLALTITYNSTPTGTEGAIWQGGVGLSSDGTAIWFSVANGTSGGNNMGMNVVKATVSGSTLINTLSHQEVADGDNDLSAGVVLVGNQVVSGGKSGNLIFLNAADASQVIRPSAGGEVHNVATWNGGDTVGQLVYTWGSGSNLHAWQATGGTLLDKGTNSEQTPGHPGGMITISSNATVAGSGILWALIPLAGDAWHSTTPGALYAFDASDITKPSLWNSSLDATTFGTYAKFSPPTVANGKVYAATFSGNLNVYGLK